MMTKAKVPVHLYIVFKLCLQGQYVSNAHRMYHALTSMPGNGVTSEPVAMIMFLAGTFISDPSSFITVTSFTPVILPSPEWWVTWIFTMSNSI